MTLDKLSKLSLLLFKICKTGLIEPTLGGCCGNYLGNEKSHTTTYTTY